LFNSNILSTNGKKVSISLIGNVQEIKDGLNDVFKKKFRTDSLSTEAL
jgi:hypothetical protein